MSENNESRTDGIVHLRVALLSEILRARGMGISAERVLEQVERCADELRVESGLPRPSAPRSTRDVARRSVSEGQTSFARRLGGDWAVVVLYPDGHEYVLAANLEDRDLALHLLGNVQRVQGRPAYLVEDAWYAPDRKTGEFAWTSEERVSYTSSLAVTRVNLEKVMPQTVVYRSDYTWARNYMLDDSRDVHAKGALTGEETAS